MRAPAIPPWEEEAACRPELLADQPVHPGDFFPERGSIAQRAKSVCSRCPVARPCLLFAISVHERYGIWGGAGDPARRALQRSLSDGATPDGHKATCTCEFCIAVDAHLTDLRHGFVEHAHDDLCEPDCPIVLQPRHGSWQGYTYAGCRCPRCTLAHRRSGREPGPK